MAMGRVLSLSAALLAVVLLAACGGNDGGSAGGSATATTGTASAAGTASAGGNACVDEATKLVDEGRADVALKAPGGPLDAGKLNGKTVWLINAVDTPLLLEVVKGFEAAGQAAGVKTQIVSAKGSAQRMNQGVASAVAQGADGIVLLAVDPRLVDGPLKKAYSADIPVVDSLVAGPDAPLDGLFAHVDFDAVKSGGLVGDWILADSGCDAEVATFASTILTIHKGLVEGSTKEIERLCPDDCNAELVEFDSTKMATDLGTSTQSVLRRNPDINYLFPVLDAGVQFVEPAVQQTGKAEDVKIVSHDGVSTNLDNLRKGGEQVLDVAFPPTPWMGWALMDQVARGILGEEPGDWEIPVRLIDSTNVGESDADLFPEYANFQDAFVKAWGTGDTGA